MKSGEIVFLGLIFLVLGMLIIFVGLMREAASSREAGGGIRGGGVIMIGPIPIIFGTDRESASVVIVLALLLIVVSYFLFRGRSG
jgi:uncharacterized protein (TIGR00304 family)